MKTKNVPDVGGLTEIAGVNIERLLRNLDETSYNEGSDALACRLRDCERVIKELLATRASADVGGLTTFDWSRDGMLDGCNGAGDYVLKRDVQALLAASPAHQAAGEPIAYLRFWAAQSWTGNGNHDVEHGEGLEVCKQGDVGTDGSPAFPVFAAPVAAHQAVVPEGFVLAPVESTVEMDSAGHDALLAAGNNAMQQDAEGCYRAMLAAAPVPPAATAEQPSDMRLLTDLAKWDGSGGMAAANEFVGRAKESLAHLARQAQAGPPRIPQTPDEAISFIGSQFESREDADNPENVRFQLTAHDLLSAFSLWFDIDTAAQTLGSVPQATAAAIHYPDCWDTAAYPTLESALIELYHAFKCSECSPEEEQAAMPGAPQFDGIAVCPFCAYFGDLHSDDTAPVPQHSVQCRSCGAEGSIEPTKEEAVAKWNKRIGPIAAPVAQEAEQMGGAQAYECPSCKGQSGGVGTDGVENDCLACFRREHNAWLAAQAIPAASSESVDTPELRELLNNYRKNPNFDTSKQYAALIAHITSLIEARVAGSKEAWISVDDKKKPKPGEQILLFVRTLHRGEDDGGNYREQEGEEVAMGEYRVTDLTDDQPYRFDCYTSPMSDSDWITHWMPLPASPASGSQDKKGGEQ
jgi:hypothetical protein